MKTVPQKQIYILERFLPIRQLPTLTINVESNKKIIELKNIYMQQKCTMKIQPLSLLQGKQRNILHQASFFQKFQGHLGVPLMIWSGQDFQCLVLVIQQLGYTLYDRMHRFTSLKRMRLKDVCMIGLQMIDIIKNLHEKNHLHRNISPQCFSFGYGQKMTKIYLNDLLQMKRYIVKNTDTHIQAKQLCKLEYLTPFLSKNLLNYKQASRRDDLISIIYVLIYLLKGLPWQEDWEKKIQLKQRNCEENTKNDKQLLIKLPKVRKRSRHEEEDLKARIQKMRQIHQKVTIKQLCQGLPKQFQQLLNLTYQLQFQQLPEYQRYKSYLRKILFKNNLKNNLLFQWMQSQANIQTNLKVKQRVINFSTDSDLQTLRTIYAPFQQGIDVDPIAKLLNRDKDLKMHQQKFLYNPNSMDNQQPHRPVQNLNIRSRNRQNCKII